MKNTFIWGIPVRIFHWLMVISLVIAYAIAGDDFLVLHVSFGYFVGVLVLFRIIYGFIGPKYANFNDFPVSPKSISSFIKSKGKDKIYFGHNPLASLVMLLIFCSVLLVVVTGTLNLAAEGQGFIQINGLNDDLVEELHELAVYLLMALVVMHLLGLIVDSRLHPKHETTLSIFTGYKQVDAENSKSNLFQNIFSFLWILIAVITFFYVINSNKIKTEEKEKLEQFEQDND